MIIWPGKTHDHPRHYREREVRPDEPPVGSNIPQQCPNCGGHDVEQTCKGILSGRDTNKRTCQDCDCQWYPVEILKRGK